MKIYRVMIVGCGPRGTRIGRAYTAHPRTTVVGVCDLDAEKARALARELDVRRVFADVEEGIRNAEPDIAVIATGTEFHYELSMRALEHGLHIDVEKPICPYLSEADEVIRKAKEKGARVAVHHQGRVCGTMRAAARVVADGGIGEILSIHASGKGYYGGYGLMNIGTHSINNVLRFGEQCESVSALVLTDGRRIGPDDVVSSPNGMGVIAGENITAVMHMKTGVPAALFQHRFPEVDSTAYCLELRGTQGRILWKTTKAWLLPVPHFLPDAEHGAWRELAREVPPFPASENVDEAELWYVDEYVRALDENRDHECSGEQARHVLEIMMAIFESGAYGERVALPQADRKHPLLRWREECGLGPPPPAPRPYPEWLAQEDRRLGRDGQ